MSAAWWRRPPPQGPAELLAENARLLGHVVASLARVHGLTGAEAEQLDSYVRRRLADDDYAILRSRGEATLLTYLVVVAEQLARELSEALWARWRQEAAAAAGDAETVATLEKLVYDDGMIFDAALGAAGVRDDVARRAELEALWARRPWGGARAGHRGRPS